MKPQNLSIYSDLPGQKINGGTIPSDIICTSSRPDIVILDRSRRKITLVELTCSFETNVEQANMNKKIRYEDLKNDLIEKGYRVSLIPIEVGSIGQINTRNKKSIVDILRNNNLKVNINRLTHDISKISLLCSFSIFQAHCQPTWTDPPYLSP